jgi:hypothetical protein
VLKVWKVYSLKNQWLSAMCGNVWKSVEPGSPNVWNVWAPFRGHTFTQRPIGKSTYKRKDKANEKKMGRSSRPYPIYDTADNVSEY